ncbi:MAG TPA: hypothetical protein DCQ06_02765 [Myxococcales bacterium]|nr:hypothetical protein [Myxococcales bacterium]
MIWLGSPRFELERRLDAIGLDPTSAAFAQAWSAAQLADTPLDIERSTRAHQLEELHRHPGPESIAPVLELTERLARRLDGQMKGYGSGWLESLSQWALGLQADYEVLRIHALRFVAMLPSLDHDTEGGVVKGAIVETINRILADDRPDAPLPRWLTTGAKAGRWLIDVLPAGFVAQATRMSVKKVAGIFIAGRTIEAAAPALEHLKDSGRSATVDQLGELVVTETEADAYRDEVLDNIIGLGRQFGPKRNKAGIPYAHVSVKTSALCAHYLADDPQGTWERVGPRLCAILSAAQELGVFVNLDAEHYAVRDLTLRMLERALASDPVLWSWPDVGIVVQAYLTDAAAHLEAVIELARRRDVCMPVRLVKGAYWDAETTEADAHGFDAPQWLNKCETDICFQQLTLRILEHGQCLQLCIGSHNLRDHCFARAARAVLFAASPEIEHQALHATYEALSQAMATLGWAVRNYIPVGSLLVGMAYLVRRVMENASQVGVLTMARGNVALDQVLVPPGLTLQEQLGTLKRRPTLRGTDPWPAFENHAPSRLYLSAHRQALNDAIDHDTLLHELRESASEVLTGPTLRVYNPSKPDELLCSVATASADEVNAAIERARHAPLGSRASRCRSLLLAAEALAAKRANWAVLVAKEAGKSRVEALADVDEAIDFLRFYAGVVWQRPEHERSGRGVIAAITPWNFPLAIPCGMVAAALVTGNSVVLKSAEQTPLTAQALVDLLHRCGIDPDALIHTPGDGPTVGATLATHPKVAGVLFTGSKAVGQILHQQLAAAVHSRDDGKEVGKVVVTEMGGKNAVIVTGSADLDEAISGVLYSAFAHAGQKCSAASRILVENHVFNGFSERLGRAAADLHVGPALAPGVQVNPVISATDRDRLVQAQRAAIQECRDTGGAIMNAGGHDQGLLVKPAVFALNLQAHQDVQSLSRQELFGPVLHIMPFDDLDTAIAAFNRTEYALTGGIFAQRQDEIEALVPELMCGNLYINRSNTGARVAIEPFGGFAMSGTGPKAGSAQYLDPLFGPIAEPQGSWTDAPPAQLDASGGKRATLPTAQLGQERTERFSQTIEQALCVVDEELRQLATELVAGWPLKLAPEATRMIPGQVTLNHVNEPRGPLAVLCARQSLGPAGLLHALAALMSGSDVVVLGASKELQGWSKLHTQLSLRGVNGLSIVEVQSWLEAANVALSPQIRAVVVDGDRRVCAPALSEALADRHDATCLPPIWCSADGPDLRDIQAIRSAHHLIRTVATNTMRHGAPLEIRSVDSDSL